MGEGQRGPVLCTLASGAWGRRPSLGNGEGKLFLLLLSSDSLGKGWGTSWGTGEVAPQGSSWHLQVKANKPVEHTEEEEGDWETNSRVAVQAVDMDEEAAPLPAAALSTGYRAAVLPTPLAAAARALVAT